MTVYENILHQLQNSSHRSLFWVLLDPDRDSPSRLGETAEMVIENGADALLVGGSYYERDGFDESVKAVKDAANDHIPVMLFPGNHRQVSHYADALLFHSLLSGRNSQYLIGEQMLAASHIKRIGLETIPMGYLLIESGSVTSVQSVTGTTPLPRDKTELIAAHALAGQYLGKKIIYLEAGSGALLPVPSEAISLTKQTVDIPVIVGGGIRRAEEADVAVRAGADILVVGNAIEQSHDKKLIAEFANAVHGHQLVGIPR